MDEKIELGNKIRKLRKELGLTQEQLAEKIELDSKHLCKIEKGVHLPTYKTLVKLAEVLNFNFNNEIQKGVGHQNPLFLKSLKILNSAKNDNEREYYLDALKFAQKWLKK